MQVNVPGGVDERANQFAGGGAGALIRRGFDVARADGQRPKDGHIIWICAAKNIKIRGNTAKSNIPAVAADRGLAAA